MGTILQDLNGFLRHMNEAVQGKAAPLWHNQQLRWNGDYHEMVLRLAKGRTAVLNIHETWLEGDRAAANSMM
jgi:uncharacterized protein YukE